MTALRQAIYEKLQRMGDLDVEIAQMKNDFSDTEEALMEDKACQTLPRDGLVRADGGQGILARHNEDLERRRCVGGSSRKNLANRERQFSWCSGDSK